MKKVFAVILSLALVATMFSGCAPEEVTHKVMDLAIIVSNRACNKIHNFKSQDSEECILSALSSGGKIYTFNLDGKPHAVGEMKAKTENINSSAAERNANNDKEQIISELKLLKAESAESDILSALRLAAETLRYSNADEKKILVFDNGLQTTGYLNFTKNLLAKDMDINYVVEKLFENHYIPDFKNAGVSQVIIQNLGQTSAPQEPLTPNMNETLTEIWKKIIEAGGSTLKQTLGSLGDSNPDDYPPCSTVPIIEDSPINGKALSFIEPVFLNEAEVAFEPGSTIVCSTRKAYEALSPVAEFMESHPAFRLLIAGCCAGDNYDSEYGIDLSRRRAEIIKDLLVEMGIDGDRLETLGLGSRNPWHIADVDLASELAEQNRVVVLLDASTRDQYGI